MGAWGGSAGWGSSIYSRPGHFSVSVTTSLLLAALPGGHSGASPPSGVPRSASRPIRSANTSLRQMIRVSGFFLARGRTRWVVTGRMPALPVTGDDDPLVAPPLGLSTGLQRTYWVPWFASRRPMSDRSSLAPGGESLLGVGIGEEALSAELDAALGLGPVAPV